MRNVIRGFVYKYTRKFPTILLANYNVTIELCSKIVYTQ